jgi:hypothetical protein
VEIVRKNSKDFQDSVGSTRRVSENSSSTYYDPRLAFNNDSFDNKLLEIDTNAEPKFGIALFDCPFVKNN